MDVKDLKRLLDAVAAAEVTEFSLETADYKLAVKRGGDVGYVQPNPPAPTASPQASPAPSAAAPTPEPMPPAPSSRHVEVTAPIVGTFYEAPSPDTPPYVKVGDRVAPGKVLCIIEAMKLMNEIEAETSGTVAEVVVRNEEPVEYGQVLFRIDPD